MTSALRFAVRPRLVALGVVMLASKAPALEAQRVVSGVPRASSVAGATVGFLTQLAVASPTAIPKSRAKCAPGECFSQFVGVKANAKWQVEVRLKVPTVGFTVDLSNPTTPSLARARLSSTSWTPLYLTGPATASLTNEATFYGERTNGKNGVVPTSTDIGLILEYRVVSVP